MRNVYKTRGESGYVLWRVVSECLYGWKQTVSTNRVTFVILLLLLWASNSPWGIALRAQHTDVASNDEWMNQQNHVNNQLMTTHGLGGVSDSPRVTPDLENTATPFKINNTINITGIRG